MTDRISVDPHAIPQHFFVDWYKNYGRTFPWRSENTSPYQFLLTEILLKQTRAGAVAKLWFEFMSKYDSLEKLVDTDLVEIEDDLHILGLSNQRAGELTRMATYLLENHAGLVPSDLESLLKVPGVGLYSGHAVLSFAYGERIPIVDTNILRFFSRYFGIFYKSPDIRRNKWAWMIAEQLLPEETENVAWHNYGLLDFTGTICVSKNPRHDLCPLAPTCMYKNSLP